MTEIPACTNSESQPSRLQERAAQEHWQSLASERSQRMADGHANDELPPAYSPQQLHDVLPIYIPSDQVHCLHTYTLTQTSLNTQILCPRHDDGTSDTNDERRSPPPYEPLYHIKTLKTGGFMNRKPHISISHNPEDKVPIAEGRFDIHGTGTTISYLNGSSQQAGASPRGTPDPPRCQRVELEDSRLQLLRTNIQGQSRWWQPLPGNRNVIELTNDVEEIIARFVCTKPSFRPPDTGTDGKKGGGKKFTEFEIGHLQLVDAMVESEEERTEVLCTAIVVIERAKRRAAFMNNQASAYGVMRSMSASSASYVP